MVQAGGLHGFFGLLAWNEAAKKILRTFSYMNQCDEQQEKVSTSMMKFCLPNSLPTSKTNSAILILHNTDCSHYLAER
jgi:hypothetical protein